MLNRTSWVATLAGSLFGAWLIVQVPGFLVAPYSGIRSIDFHSYRLAADAWLRGENLYSTPEQARGYWLSAHRNETALGRLTTLEQRQSYLRAQAESPQTPGPYLYPPTLALAIAQSGIDAPAFAGLVLLSVLAFGWLWLHVSNASAVWLLWVVFSWDALISVQGANVEIILLFLTLLACWSLWKQRPLLAAPPVAAILLVKPFYAAFFAAFAALLLACQPAASGPRRRAWSAAAGLIVALVAAEMLRWGDELRRAALSYLQGGPANLWYALPPDEQTPFAIWNRNLAQAWASLGIPPDIALGLALAAWAGLLAVTIARARASAPTFSQMWALALVLFYLTRPVGWTLVYLEIAVLVAIWPWVSTRFKAFAFAGGCGLAVSHWLALLSTARGYDMRLLTLQSATFPWETWIVLPACWWMLLMSLPRQDVAPAPARF